MTTRGPASTHSDIRGVIDVADIDSAPGYTRALHLRMATQAKIGITLGEQLRVDAAMRSMTGRAPFSQRRMLEGERARLLAVTRCARLIHARHGEAACRLHNIHSMWVMALGTIELVFENGMPLGQVKLGFDLPVTFEAEQGIFARVKNVLSSTTAAGNVEAGGTMARFTSGQTQTLWSG